MIAPEKINELFLTVQEYAFVAQITVGEARDTFLNIMSRDRLPRGAQLPVTVLGVQHKNLSSVDKRFDKMNGLILTMSLMAPRYREYLSIASHIKKKAFLNGHTVFYKICTPEQLKHAADVFESKAKETPRADNDIFDKPIPKKLKK